MSPGPSSGPEDVTAALVSNVGRVSLLIIDSNVLFREGLRELLSETQFEVIHEASDMREGLEIVRADQDLGMALLDFRENDADRELQILKQMRSVNKEVKLVVLANGGSAIQLARTLDAGADGYLPQSLSREALVVGPT